MDELIDLDTSDGNPYSISPIKSLEFNSFNISDLPTVFNSVSDGTEVTELADPVYEQFLADVWVGIVLTLMVLSCVCFMCSCLIYHKIQEWKHRVADARNAANLEAGAIETDLPSYTIASGLPTYEEALEQLKQVKDQCNKSSTPKVNVTLQEINERRRSEANAISESPGNTLSVFNLFGIYSRSGESGASKPA